MLGKPRGGVPYKNNKKLLSIFLNPVPLGQDCFRQFPIPGLKGPDLSSGLPVGGGGVRVVTGGIEPYITVMV